MLRRWFALVALASVAFVACSAVISILASHPHARPVRQSGSLVMVSMPTLSWNDISATGTPALWGLAQRGAVAAQTTRDLSGHSCSDQSWLTFSAGERVSIGPAVPATSPGQLPGGCSPPLAPQLDSGSAVFRDWASWRHQSKVRGAPARIGRLSTALLSAGQCVAAAGAYTAFGAANSDGVISNYTPDVDSVDLTTCPITLIGLPGPDDAYLARLLRRLPADATIIVTGMADDSKPETLHTVIVAGPGVPHGLLTSLSTRQPGFIQTTDLSALVLARLGGDSPVLTEGRRPVVRPVASSTAPITRVTGLTNALNIEEPFVPRFFGLFLGGSGLAAAIGLAWWGMARLGQRKRGEPPNLPRALHWWFAVIGAMCASMPVATFLAGLLPWWRSAHPLVALSAAVIGVSAVLTALALLGPWRRWVAGPMTFLIIVTLFTIAEDLVHGSRLQFISLMGLQPVYGGRYFGQGNVAYAVFATAALLLAVVAADRLIQAGHRRVAATTVVLIGLAAVIVDGSPSWGADGGGPAAMMPAFAYLALNAAGLSLTWKRLAVILSSTLTVVAGFAVLDYLRPPRYRTHLGDFVAQLVKTGQLDGLKRIVTENWTMLTSTSLNMTVALLLVATMLVLVMPRLLGRPLQPLLERVPFLGHGLAAVAVCWLLGFLSNDSGTAIPPTGLLVVIPLLILLAACLHGARGAESTPQTDDLDERRGTGGLTRQADSRPA